MSANTDEVIGMDLDADVVWSAVRPSCIFCENAEDRNESADRSRRRQILRSLIRTAS